MSNNIPTWFQLMEYILFTRLIATCDKVYSMGKDILKIVKLCPSLEAFVKNATMPVFYISWLESFKANIAGHGDSFQMVCLNVFLQITICRFLSTSLAFVSRSHLAVFWESSLSWSYIFCQALAHLKRNSSMQQLCGPGLFLAKLHHGHFGTQKKALRFLVCWWGFFFL